MAEQKVACYLCEGCGIGERLDMESLVQDAEQGADAQWVRRHASLCSESGLEMIHADKAEEAITHICIAACSPRAMTQAFHDEDVPVSRANLREGVIWARPRDGEEADLQAMARDAVRMAVNEVRFMNPASVSGEQGRNEHILVVGGGVTGMTAALEAARAGYRVSIVEKSDRLGGAMGLMKSRSPSHSPYIAPQDTGILGRVAEIENSEAITVHLSSTVARVAGAPGRFLADIANESGSTFTDGFGAIIQATGFRHHDVAGLTEFGYAEHADVITQMELEGLAIAAADGPIKRPSDGKEVRSVLFIQCAGQRSDREGHLPYCSGHCCATSMKQAMYFKDQNPAVKTEVLYTDLRVTGTRGEGFYLAARRRGVIFARGKARSISPGAKGPTVSFSDLTLGEERSQTYDLIVLANGMEPSVGQASMLNLDYQQGAELPAERGAPFAGVDSFTASVPGARLGINAAGSAVRPMAAYEAMEDGAHAALKAIQSLEAAALGQAPAPRSGERAYPRFLEAGCTRCARCIQECPVSAIEEGEDRYPDFNESRCTRCAICVGACPEQVVSLDDYSVDGFRHRIVEIPMPKAEEHKPRLLVLACENSAQVALDMAAHQGLHWSVSARVVPVRCLGAVNALWLSDALNAGYDGILLMGCGPDRGGNSPCQFADGLALARKRIDEIGDVMERLGLEAERIAIQAVDMTRPEHAPALINQMAQTIETLGPNPAKGSSTRSKGRGAKR
ncbi:MAG: FAD-dependent oxidoreductase [Gammaproteobacteria bacterium]